MLIGEFDPRLSGADVEISDPRALEARKRQVELSFCSRFWPKHPRLLRFAEALGAMAAISLAYLALVLITVRCGQACALFAAIPVTALAGWACLSLDARARSSGIRWERKLFADYNHCYVPAGALQACMKIARADSAALKSLYVETPSDLILDTAFLLYAPGPEACLVSEWDKIPGVQGR